MANLKEVRIRIGSVNTTMQITKAMKLVAASKLRRAQDRITMMRPYSEKLNYILGNITAGLEGDVSMPLSKEREPKNILIVVFTSDKGLCGGFNSNLIKTANRLLNETYAAQRKAGNVTIMCIGKKGHDALKKNADVNFITDHLHLFSTISFDKSQTVSTAIADDFVAAKYDVVELVYAKFLNAASQDFKVERFLPFAKNTEEKSVSKSKADYIFQPAKEKLLEELGPKILNTQFFKAMLDTNASEHGARMVAMEAATNNANELLKSLKILYNRERQAAITKEILEIVGGAAALEEK